LFPEKGTKRATDQEWLFSNSQPQIIKNDGNGKQIVATLENISLRQIPLLLICPLHFYDKDFANIT
jgi:hypothetical protein